METTTHLDARERIVLPLDVSSAQEAERLVSELAEYVGMFKIGYELGYSIGWHRAAEIVMQAGGKVFFDTKFDDIPNTVGKGTAALSKLNPQIINVHASCGIEAMQAAVASKGKSQIFAVTVLTSIAETDCLRIYGSIPQAKVVQLALDAAQAKVDGIICSPQELTVLAKEPKLTRLMKMTPGVRPDWAATDDQQRIMTPGEAVKAGADYLVIGRPITQPPAEVGKPVHAAKKIAEEIK